MLDRVKLNYIHENKKRTIFGFYPSKSYLINIFMRDYRMTFKQAKEATYSQYSDNIVIINKSK